MPTATSGCENFSDFLALHKAQLEMSAVPQRYWHTLFTKLKNEVFDSGDTFTMYKVREVFDDEDYESEVEDVGGAVDDMDQQEELYTWRVTVSRENGISMDDTQHIYLINHAWTYTVCDARRHLETKPELLERMVTIMDIPTANCDKEEVIDIVLQDMWRFNQVLTKKGAEEEGGAPVWYVMDEFGSRIQHSDTPTMKATPICYLPAGTTYTLLWPTKNLAEGEEITRNFVQDGATNALTRKVKLLPWQPDDMTHLSYEQHEEMDSFMVKYKLHETLPDLDMDFPGLPRDRNITLYTDMDLIASELTDNRFELVKDREEADIICTDKYMRDFRSFSEESPEKLINQYPFEMVITMTDLLAMVCRRAGCGLPDPDTLDTTPAWMQTTYNLMSELPQFVSYFQHRDTRGMENYWICKPLSGERRSDTHITNNLGHILRTPDSGPKVACKYVEDPVLIEREGIGMTKFDTRFVIMLHSVDPLLISVHKKFVIRMADKEFGMDNFDDPGKHFTSEDIGDITCDDFVGMYEAQYPAYPWNNVELEMYEIIKDLFNLAVSQEPPQGIGNSPQSRGMYGFDFLLKWITNDKGERAMQPVLVNVTSVPDLKRHCQNYPSFINQCFSALFLDDFESNAVMVL